MKKTALILLIITLPIVAISQPCPDSLYLTSQAQVDSFPILYPNCTEIEGNVIIRRQFWQVPNISNLSGISELTFIGGSLIFIANDSLLSLDGLENLSFIDGHLILGSNDVWWGENSLTNLNGLKNLDSIGGSLMIDCCNSLSDLSGLNNLISIGGDLIIGGYATTFCGGNQALISLSGLDNIGYIGGKLTIISNYMLSECAIQSICNYITTSINTIEIMSNAQGCNSRQEIETACDTLSTQEFYSDTSLTICPNPFTTSTTLSYTLDKPSTVTISIFNPQSQLVEKIEQEQPKGEQQVHWNAEGLPAGIYYFRIHAGEMIGGGKMVKM